MTDNLHHSSYPTLVLDHDVANSCVRRRVGICPIIGAKETLLIEIEREASGEADIHISRLIPT